MSPFQRPDLNITGDLAFCLSVQRVRNFLLVPDNTHYRQAQKRG